VNRLPLGRAPTLALVHAIALVAGTAARADDVEAPEATLIVNSPPFQNVWSSRFFMATI